MHISRHHHLSNNIFLALFYITVLPLFLLFVLLERLIARRERHLKYQVFDAAQKLRRSQERLGLDMQRFSTKGKNHA